MFIPSQLHYIDQQNDYLLYIDNQMEQPDQCTVDNNNVTHEINKTEYYLWQ